MFKWLLHKGTAAFERQWNYDAGYVHELIDIDPRAAWMFQRATGLGKYRKDVPLEALFAAGITAVRSEDFTDWLRSRASSLVRLRFTFDLMLATR